MSFRSQGNRTVYGRFNPTPSRGRSFYRGRASPFRGRGSGRNSSGRDVLDGLVPMPLKTILQGETTPMFDIVIRDLQYLASYNWDNSEDPVIIVPGSPRMWLNRPVPFKVNPDSGHAFVDQSSHRMPSYPLLPLFRAVDFMEQERESKFEWSSVDIITDRSSIRKLLAFAQGSTEQFRIDIQLAGLWTVLFHRWEARHLDSDDMRGYADSFERATTALAPGMKDWTGVGHHRIISYDFAGLKVVLRYAVEAYYPSEIDKPPGYSKKDDTVVAEESFDPLDDLTRAISALDIARPSQQPATTDPTRTSDVRIVRGGAEVPQSSLIKLKTRSERSVASFDWGRFYPQQFLGQIPTQIMAVHRAGTFYDIQEQTLDAPEFQAVADEAQKGLKKLHHILEEIHNFAMAHGKEARLSLVCRDGVLQVMQRESADSYLPSDVLKRFNSFQ